MESTEQKINDRMGYLASEILTLLRSGKSTEQLVKDIILLIQKTIDIESVGIRLSDGQDFPYYFTQGFEQEFVNKEMHLCSTDQLGELIRDSEGNPVLECMCGNVICGRTDPIQPFFTKGGSFWYNCTTELLATTSDKERQSRTRNRCNGEGYESVALIPINIEKKCWGLLQLNDHRKDMFTLAMITFLEGVTINIGYLISMFKMREQLASQAADVTRAAVVRGELLSRLAKELQAKHGSELTLEREANIIKKIDLLLDEVEMLKGIVPICSVCKRVRVDPNYWIQVESFVSDRSKVQFSHTYCPECFAAWKNSQK